MIEINKIYNEDCLLGMKKIENGVIDIVLTSPPYNINRPNSKDRGYDLYKDRVITNAQYNEWICNIFNEYDRVLKKDGCVLWNMSYGNENSECMSLCVGDIITKTNFTLADIIVWKKPTATPNNVSHNKLTRIVEFIYVFCRKEEYATFITNKREVSISSNNQKIYENLYNYIDAPNNDESTELNKATFSSILVCKLLDIYAKPNYVVLDTFMGTGTTAIGCINRNMNYIGFEISKAQCDYAQQRIIKRLENQTFFDVMKY